MSTDPVFIQAPHQRLRLLSKDSSTADQSDRRLIDSGLGCSSDRGACHHRMQPTESWCRSSGQARLLPSLHWVWSCENAFEEDSRLTQRSLPIVSSPAILQQTSTPPSFSLVVRRVPPQPQHTTPAAGKIGPAEVTGRRFPPLPHGPPGHWGLPFCGFIGSVALPQNDNCDHIEQFSDLGASIRRGGRACVRADADLHPSS